MTTIFISESNQQTSEKLVDAILASTNPKETMVRTIQSLLDHPWMDDELHQSLIQNTAGDLGLTVEGGAAD